MLDRLNQARRTLGLAKSTFYRKTLANKPAERLEKRIKALSRKHPRYGYRMITQLLRAEGWRVNRKRVQRVCAKKVASGEKEPETRRTRCSKPSG